MLAGGIDDLGAELVAQKGVRRIDILPAAQLEGVMVEADIALPIFALAACGVGARDPKARLAVGPADHVAVLVGELESEKLEEPRIKTFRFCVVADADDQ